jgi:hypothetical protein
MTRKLLAWPVLIMGVALAMAYGVAGAAAWADAQQICPADNQCSDAVGTMLMSAVVLSAISAINLVALRIIFPRANR